MKKFIIVGSKKGVRGSVDINPLVWVNIFIQNMVICQEKDKLYISRMI